MEFRRVLFRSKSLHSWDNETLIDNRSSCGPALSHCFRLGEKADAVCSILIAVAESGTLPASEAEVGNRYRDRHIDADHPDIYPMGKFARGVTVAGDRSEERRVGKECVST